MKKLLLTFVLLGTSLNAAITRVQVATATVTSGTTAAITFSSTPGTGNQIILGVATGNNTGAEIVNVTDNQGTPGNGYARIQSGSANGAAIQSSMWCGAATTSSGTFTITVHQSISGLITLFAIEYSGASCTIDKNDWATGGTSPYSCGSFTTLNANDLVLSMINNNGGGTITFTAPTGFTIRSQNTNGSFQGAAIADDIVSSTAAFTPTWTVSTTATTNCTLAALQQASGGGGGGGGGSAVFP